MNIAVIQFPGTNCERETHLALKRSNLTPIDFFWNEPLEKLEDFKGFVIAGGFSYEDRIRSGLIASKSPIMQKLKGEAKKGKPILGICNGAQILVESGLVPGNEKKQVLAALTRNKNPIGGFYNDLCTLKPFSFQEHHAFTNQFKPGMQITIPFAHAEGRFIIAKDVLDEMIKNESQMLQYSDLDNKTDMDFPINPNGSDFNLAAISNKSGNVMAIMPHPERTDNGQVIFDSMREYILNQKAWFKNKDYQTEISKKPLMPYQCPQSHFTLIIDAVIEDNSAKSLALLLLQNGYPVEVKRHVFYQIKSKISKNETLSDLAKTEMLWNSHKEFPLDNFKDKNEQSLCFLVKSKDDCQNQNLLNSLHNHFNLTHIETLQKGILYQFNCPSQSKEKLKNHLLENHLIFNPLSEECYDFCL